MTFALVPGFIGLGKMGHPMAANITGRGGFPLVCFDAAGTTDRLPAGATAADSIASVVAAADVVFFSVPDAAATAAVVEAIVGAPERRATTVVDLSTIGPSAAQANAARLAEVGIEYCDGPVSGGAAGARAATISLMFGGAAETLERLRPILASFAGSIFHVGDEPAKGQAMKLVNNFLSATALAASSEAFAMGEAAGLDLATMVDVVNVSSGRNTATSDKFPNRVLTGTYDAGFATAHMTKDVGLFLAEATALGTATAVTAAVTSTWRSADAEMPGSDFTEIWTHVRRGGPPT